MKMKMKIAIALAISILTIQASAKSNVYVGIDAVNSYNDFTLDVNNISAATGTNDSIGFKVKVGTANDNGWRLQAYYLNETYDESIFDATNDTLHEVGMDLIKGFEVTSKFSPFIQVGIGYGWMNVDGYTDSSIDEYSIKVGAGVMYKVTPEVEVIAGYDYQTRKWQDIAVGVDTVSITEDSSKLYVGINYHF
jgi:opacity protein-like surface antigen